MSYGISVPIPGPSGQVTPVDAGEFGQAAQDAIDTQLQAFNDPQLRERIEAQLLAAKWAAQAIIDSASLAGPQADAGHAQARLYKASINGHAEIGGGIEWVTVAVTASNPPAGE